MIFYLHVDEAEPPEGLGQRGNDGPVPLGVVIKLE